MTERMRRLLLAICLVALSCGVHAEQPHGPQDRLRVADIDTAWFRIAERFPPLSGERERELSRQYPGRILRWGNLLALRLVNGKFVWLVDMSGPSGFGCCEVYHLADVWPDQGLYVVNVGFGEYARTWLIAEQTADVTEVVGTPHRDPADPTLFVSLLGDDMAGWQIELWQKDDVWKRRYRCDQVAFAPTVINWKSHGEAVVGGIDGSGGTRESRLRLVDGTWSLDACEDKGGASKP